MLNHPVSPISSTSKGVRAEAEAGNADAQFALALCLAAGPEPQDYATAMGWYLKAAQQNHRLAQFNLGQMYAQGQGVPKDDAAALAWIRRAAEGGDAGAQFALGGRYARASLHGTGMDAAESRIESYKWFTLAAAQEYLNALVSADSATMRMTREEVSEGARRVNAFTKAE